MLLIIRTKIDSQSRSKVAEDLKGYIKVVVDIRRGILSAGGLKHVDGEQHTSREILDQKIREQVEQITRSFLKPA